MTTSKKIRRRMRLWRTLRYCSARRQRRMTRMTRRARGCLRRSTSALWRGRPRPAPLLTSLRGREERAREKKRVLFTMYSERWRFLKSFFYKHGSYTRPICAASLCITLSLRCSRHTASSALSLITIHVATRPLPPHTTRHTHQHDHTHSSSLHLLFTSLTHRRREGIVVLKRKAIDSSFTH
jgi:hypothetical protein